MVANFTEVTAADDSRQLGFDLVDVVRILWNAKWLVLLSMLIATAVMLSLSLALPKSFLAKGEVVVRAEASVSPDADREFYATAVNAAVVATEQNVMGAQGLLTRVAESVNFPTTLEESSWLASQFHIWLTWISGDEPVSEQRAQELRQAARYSYIRSVIHTVVDKDSSVIAVEALTPYANFSADIVNQLLDYYMQGRTAAQSASNRNVAVALQERLRQTNDQIRDSENHIATLLQAPHMIENTEIPGPQRELSLLGADLSKARSVAAEQLAAYSAAASLSAAALNDPTRLGELMDMGGLSTSNLRMLYDKSSAELARMSKTRKPALLTSVQAEVDILRSRLVGEASRIVAQRKASLDAANQYVDTLTRQYDGIRNHTSSDSSALLELSRDRDNLTNLRRVAGTIQDRLISVAAQPIDPNARVLTQAVPPVLSAFPNKLLFCIIGALGGLIISSLTLITFGYLHRLRVSAFEQTGLMGAPLLASIPKVKAIQSRRAGVLDQPVHLGLGEADNALVAATIELENVIARSDAKILTITSAVPDEGKSTIAVALARRLAVFGWRVLLLHCDLHPGATRYAFGDERELVADKAPLPGTLLDRHSPLHVLTFPIRANPIEFLHSNSFRDILGVARQEYDLVLCDTPPALSVPDALVVARLSDSLILVWDVNRTGSPAQTFELSRRIAAIGKPVAAVIATKTNRSSSSYNCRSITYSTAALSLGEAHDGR